MRNYTGYGYEGDTYKENLGIKEIASIVRKELKKRFPDCTFSVRIERYSMGQSLHISLMSAPFDPFLEKVHTQHGISEQERENLSTNLKHSRESGYAQINQYQFKEYGEGLNNGTPLSLRAWEVLKVAVAISQGYNYDDSDGMIDYFDCNFFLHVNIGHWEKPFVNTAQKEALA